MRASRQIRHSEINIWPGFVDALVTLVMTIVFVLIVFVVGQYLLSISLTNKDTRLSMLNEQLSALSKSLIAEKRSRKEVENRYIATHGLLLNKEKEIQLSKSEVIKAVSEIAALKAELERLVNILSSAEETNKNQQVQIATLDEKLAQVLAEKVEQLQKYRSEFFGKMREILGARSDIQVRGDRFVFQSEVLFASGSSSLSEAGKVEIKKLAQALNEISVKIPKDLAWVLSIEGHTDVQKIVNTSVYKSNWELSTARALSVLHFLTENGVAAKNLAATGYGEFQPLNADDTPEAYEQNRRIELKFTSR